jgi:sugar porter (SP) family MFS transporter
MTTQPALEQESRRSMGKASNQFVVVVALVVAMGGFLLGFDATVISGAVPFVKKYFALEGTSGDFLLGLAVSCLGWGALGGNAVAGFMSDRFGRKKVLLVTAVFFAVSALISATATNFAFFVFSRVLGGIAVGGAILIAPVYIAEISPSKLRGTMVSFNQMMIVIGISASFFSNYFLLNLGTDNWRWMLGVEAAPAVLYFIFLLFVPESPRWLLNKGREPEARAVFTKVGGAEHAEEELRSINENFAAKASRPKLGGLFGRKMSRIMFIALAIAFFQQITGINAIFYYLPTIFVQAGGGEHAAFSQAILVGLVNLFMTFVAMWLIDRAGRKPLLLVGSAGMAAALLTCAWAFNDSNYQFTDKSYAVLQTSGVPADLIADLKQSPALPAIKDKDAFLAAVDKQLGAARVAPYRDAIGTAGLNIRASLVLMSIIGFVASFAISLGPVMWVLLSEIFPNEYRGAAISLVGFWNSVVSATVTMIFPWELSHLGSAGTFLGYGIMALCALFFVLAFIPETKRKTLEELEGVLLRH